jgi:aspartyl-tRNA(Asn)/glutamyl-tRNA(Gln) amidotransferase subunit A
MAGAIIVGKNTTSEFAHKLMTDSPMFGVTRNPWALDRTPGGSSGGSAVAVAAGLGPLSLATDAGASTRLPAACTGIVGLKPTLGVIPHSQVPDGFNNFIHIGVMARTVRDTALMLDSLAGEHPSDPHSLGVAAPHTLAALDDGRSLSGARIAFRPLLGNPQLDREVRHACEAALDDFRAAGCTVDIVDAPTENAEPAWRILQQSNWAARFHAKLFEVEDKIDPSFAEGIRAGGSYSGQQLLQATYKRTQHFRTVQGWFADYDFILTPTASRPPLPVTHRALDPITVNGVDVGDMRASWISYLSLFDLTGHPAVSVPCGWTADGLPIGIQIVGPWYADAQVLKAAALLEQARPWADRHPREP